MKQFIGYFLIASPFIAIFIMSSMSIGIKQSLIVFGISMFTCGIIVLGVALIK